MSCHDGKHDDAEDRVREDKWTEDNDMWIFTVFEVDKYGNLYVASYESILAKYAPPVAD